MRNSRQHDLVLFGFFLLVAFGSGMDLYADISLGVNRLHLIKELVILLAALTGIAWMGIGFKKSRIKILKLNEQLETARALADRQSNEMKDAKRRMSDVIHAQFEKWQLTGSEQQVGRLMLKGLSFREIAGVRAVSEKTIRQQASSIYQKSGLGGRHEFAAWFLEDLF
jgi:DNA-binding CsgD family transcriptional regulator